MDPNSQAKSPTNLNPLELRANDLKQTQQTEFDLCVVGGGITGVGIARDAAARGLKVILLEKADFASGTSSQSSKLLHGGVRYMEHFEFGLVRESIRERDALCRNAAHLARPLPFIYPIFETDRHGPFSVNIGMWLYSAFAGFRRDRRHKMLKVPQLKESEPGLKLDGIRGATQYIDCLTDDGRLTLETALDARELGATLITRAEVSGLLHDDDQRVIGVRCHDLLQNNELEVKSKKTVIALGPWTDKLLGKIESDHSDLLRPTKGVHVVVDKKRLSVQHAIVMRHVDDQRVLFVIPWNERTIIGTTDTDDELGPDNCFADKNDVEYLLKAANHYFPAAQLNTSDVISTWSGLRPLLRADGVDPSEVSREHEIRELQPGLITIFGGKLTTYREMAEQCVDFCKLTKNKSNTLQRYLPGCAEDFEAEALQNQLCERFEIDTTIAQHLVNTYGTRSTALLEFAVEQHLDLSRIEDDLPFIWAEVSFVTKFEFALTTIDCLRRRLQIFLKSTDQGLKIVERVGELQAAVLGWSSEEKTKNIQDYRDLVAKSRSF